MNLSDIRDLTRRRLNDQPGDNWDDATLLAYINLAYANIQKQIRKVDPEFLVFWDTRATVAGTSWYEKPSQTRGIIEVGLKTSAADTDWTALTRKPYYIARDNTDVSEVVYCHRGLYIGIFPAPTVSVSSGLQILHLPTDQLAVDTDVPKVELSLHYAIAVWATLIAKGENPESDAKDALELARLLADIPLDYATNDLSQPMLLNPDVSDARARGTQLWNSSPGVDRR